jgi:hypothetical protein
MLDLSLPGERTTEVSEPPDDWATYDTVTDIQFVGPHIRGDLGGVQNVDAAAFGAEGYVYAGQTSITIRGRNETGVLMTMIDYSGDLASADPSTHASAVGCSGPEDNFWETDVPADDVQIQSSRGSQPGFIRVDVSASFGVTGRIATWFEYDPNAVVDHP